MPGAVSAVASSAPGRQVRCLSGLLTPFHLYSTIFYQ